MADVYAVFGTLLALGIAFPGMLTAWRLIFPELTERASHRLDHTPWKALLLGAVLAGPLALVLAVLSASPYGPVKFVGAIGLIGMLAFASLGASGLAAVMGRRLAAAAGGGLSELAGFVRGALALELAAAFPIIGWMLVIPTVTLAGLGAAAFAVLGWMPSAAAAHSSPAGQPEPNPAGA